MVTDERHWERRDERKRRGQLSSVRSNEMSFGDEKTNLEQRNDILIRIIEPLPLLDKRRHQDSNESSVVESLGDRVSERSDGVVEDEEVLLLVLGEGEDEVSDDGFEVGLEKGSSFLLESSER